MRESIGERRTYEVDGEGRREGGAKEGGMAGRTQEVQEEGGVKKGSDKGALRVTRGRTTGLESEKLRKEAVKEVAVIEEGELKVEWVNGGVHIQT